MAPFFLLLTLAALPVVVEPVEGQRQDDRAGRPREGQILLRPDNQFGQVGQLPQTLADLDPLPPDTVLRSRSLAPEVEALLRELDAPEFERRRTAHERLREDPVTVDDLLTALARGELSEEMRHRLLAITVDRIVNAPRGALGIRMDLGRNPGLAPEGGGVRVTGLVEGMPAAQHLQVDDVIVAINGRALRDRDELVSVVQSLAPGTMVQVEAVRAERDERGKPRLDPAGQPLTRRVEVAFALGSTRDLARDEDQQGGMVANPVTGQRLELARSVMRRYAPVATLIQVPEDRLAAERLAQQSPDIHPDVQSLLRWRELVAMQGGVWDETTLDLLQGTLAELRRRASDPSLTAAERGWFARVADRYVELIPPPDQP